LTVAAVLTPWAEKRRYGKQARPLEQKVAKLHSEMGRRLGTLRFASDPLDDPHPELSLVAYGLRSRDVFRRGDLFGGQAQ